MHTNQIFSARSVSLTALAVLAGVATMSLHAQQPVSGTPAAATPNMLLATAVTPTLILPATADIGYTSPVGANESSSAENYFIPNAAVSSDATQPPPRRRYGRPRYNDNSHNPDGSSKYTFEVGAGFTVPIGNTSKYYKPSWKFSVGGGRQFSKSLAVLLQFDYDHLGLQQSVISNQEYIYNYTPNGSTGVAAGLGGNAHDWSFTVDPTYTFLGSDSSNGAYVVAGGGFYHKVTNFTLPQTVATYYGYYNVNENVDHYTSNAFGVNGGLGFTHKISRFANEKLFMEVKYVVTFNSQRTGITAYNVAAQYYTYQGNNFFPANSNRTTYIPVTFGLRF